VAIVRLAGDVTLFIEEAWAIHGEAGSRHQVYGSQGGVRLNPFTFYTNVSGIDADMARHGRLVISAGAASPGDRRLCQLAAALGRGPAGRVPMINTGKIGWRCARSPRRSTSQRRREGSRPVGRVGLTEVCITAVAPARRQPHPRPSPSKRRSERGAMRSFVTSHRVEWLFAVLPFCRGQ